MIPETENTQKAKSVYPGKPARHAKADLGRYITQFWFSRGMTHMSYADVPGRRMSLLLCYTKSHLFIIYVCQILTFI